MRDIYYKYKIRSNVGVVGFTKISKNKMWHFLSISGKSMKEQKISTSFTARNKVYHFITTELKLSEKRENDLNIKCYTRLG